MLLRTSICNTLAQTILCITGGGMAGDEGVRAKVDEFVYFSSLLLGMLAVTASLTSHAPGGNLSCTASHAPGSGKPLSSSPHPSKLGESNGSHQFQVLQSCSTLFVSVHSCTSARCLLVKQFHVLFPVCAVPCLKPPRIKVLCIDQGSAQVTPSTYSCP